MSEHIGGHWRDTGDGWVSVDPPLLDPAGAQREPAMGAALEAPVNAAWRKYVNHLRGEASCPQCSRSVFRCPTGNGLWDAYIGARSAP